MSLLPFTVARKRRFDFDLCEGVGGATKRAKLPGCLPSAAAAVPGVQEATSVRLGAHSLAWARQQSCDKWYPVQVETDTFESDGRVVVLHLAPPHARESLLVENVKRHSDAASWQALRDRTLHSLAPEGAGAVAAYNAAVAALLRKHAKSHRQLDPQTPRHSPSQHATAASTSLPPTFSLSISKRPLRIGGAPCVVMDSHSRVPMKLRHRVLGKLVEGLQAALANAVGQDVGAATDQMIMAGRVHEAELYHAVSSKGEYQNRATSKIRSLRTEKQQELPQVHQSAASTQKCTEGYELTPEELLLSAADLALNQFPMTPDMVSPSNSCISSCDGTPVMRRVKASFSYTAICLATNLGAAYAARLHEPSAK